MFKNFKAAEFLIRSIKNLFISYYNVYKISLHVQIYQKGTQAGNAGE